MKWQLPVSNGTYTHRERETGIECTRKVACRQIHEVDTRVGHVLTIESLLLLLEHVIHRKTNLASYEKCAGHMDILVQYTIPRFH